MKIGIVGAGSWGTALAIHIGGLNHVVNLWVYEEDVYQDLQRERENKVYLPSFKVPDNVRMFNRLDEAVDGCEIVIRAVPSKYCRNVIKQIKDFLRFDSFIVSATKGIETESFKRMSEVLIEELGVDNNRIGILSGPSFAREVAAGNPTAIVIASTNKKAAMILQKELSSRTLRIYYNSDVIGVELGGSLKNVIAIAAGIIEGLGYGHNTMAALITRGLTEMKRLAKCLNARPDTLSGLSGLGDLVLTCTGTLSRNKLVGIQLSKGLNINQITSSMRMVAEGVPTSKSVLYLKNIFDIEMPISEKVYHIIYNNMNPQKAIEELMLRDLKEEILD